MSSDSNSMNITTILGPPFVAVILNWGLFGVLSIQVYIYCQAFPNDRLWLKVLVWGVYILDMTQLFLVTDTVWKVLVSGFGNIEVSDEVGTTWLSICFIGGLVAFLVHCFYAYRIAVLSQKWIAPAGIIFVSLISFAGAISTSVIIKQAEKFTMMLVDKRRTFVVIGIWGATDSICDVMIAVCMCYYLHRRRGSSQGSFSQTEALVSKLIRMSVETGILTAATSTLTLALYYPPAVQYSAYFEVPPSVLAKLYSATMMVVLNSRVKRGIVSKSITWRDNELAFAPPHSTADANHVELTLTSRDRPFQNTNVVITKEEIVTTDGDKIDYLSPSLH